MHEWHWAELHCAVQSSALQEAWTPPLWLWSALLSVVALEGHVRTALADDKQEYYSERSLKSATGRRDLSLWHQCMHALPSAPVLTGMHAGFQKCDLELRGPC